ncbi:hypothetical protein QR685DRAFT_548462 [Neurospora intermedia]|uniref:Uncharacterized protein n=1 Tax=Neurospora intermedia TaxID=5142 RepID=A0ABR3CYK6_NEUIN
MFGRRRAHAPMTSTSTKTTRPMGSGLFGRRRAHHTTTPMTTTTHTTHHTTRRRGYGRKRHHGVTPTAATTMGTTAAVHHHQKRKTSLGDKISGALMKIKGSITGRPGQKAAGTRRMRGTDGRGRRRHY